MLFNHLERSVVLDNLSACLCNYSCSTVAALRACSRHGNISSTHEDEHFIWHRARTYAGHRTHTLNQILRAVHMATDWHNTLVLQQGLQLRGQLAGLDELQRCGIHAIPGARSKKVSAADPQRQVHSQKATDAGARLLPVGRGPSLNTCPAQAEGRLTVCGCMG